MNKNLFPLFLNAAIFVSLFSVKLIPLVIIFCILLWLFYCKDFSKFKARIKYFIPYLIYVLVFILAFTFSENKSQSVKELERFSSFIIFPLIIFFSTLSNAQILKFKKFFTLTTLAIVFISLVSLLVFALKNQDLILEMDDTYLQWKMPHLLGYHPSYFGLIIVIATKTLLFDKAVFYSYWINYTIVFILTVFLIYISPRVAIISQLLLIAYFIFFAIDMRKSIKGLLIFSGIVSIVLITNNSSFFKKKMQRSIKDERFLLWKPAFQTISNNFFLLGEGLGDGELIFNQYLSKNGDFRKNLKGSTDLHNQYLENFVSAGIFGFLSLLVLLFWSPFLLKRKELYALSLIFLVAFFTESVLNIIKGIVIFNVVLSIFTLNAILNKQN